MRNRLRTLALLSTLSLVVAACGGTAASPSAAPASQAAPSASAAATQPAAGGATPSAETVPTTYPRNETLYTSGTQYGPPNNWNPIVSWGYATGTLGLLYEPLFTYDPLTNTYRPWLADPSSGYTSDKEYTIKLRPGITWTDGQPLTADDVVFTLNLGHLSSVSYNTIWNFLDSVTAVDQQTVKVTFKTTAYQQWANFLYNNAIVPKHLWEGKMDKEDTVLGANEHPIGSGPYMFLTSDQDRMVWVKNDSWWGKSALNIDPKPKYIVDLVNGGNNVMLGLVLQGQLDISNNFLPGTASLLASGYLKTYYDKAPYHMAANTAWLMPNTLHKPLNDVAFRRALAESVDVNRIVTNVYGGLVTAANPTGLLPIWDQYVDKAEVAQYGFKFSTSQAKADLAAAGYKDVNGDGFVENKDGSPIKLSLIVPTGWSDWEEAIRSIAASAQAAGINVVADTTNDYNARVDKIQNGTYDLAIMNDQQMSNTPWTYYNWIFYQPSSPDHALIGNGNLSRYDNATAWDLVHQLDQTKVDDTAGMQAVLSKLEKIMLTDLPAIPLWYNGLWAQMNDSVWTNWPNAATGPKLVPSTWRGYWQMDSIQMLDQLKLAAK